MQPYTIFGVFALVVLASLVVAPRRVTAEGFFRGQGLGGDAPGLWMLVLSQVTTWIFARSLMNSAILGYYYGSAGVLAYAAYYGSFLTGGFIVGRLRAQGAGSVQDWLAERFGAPGTVCYNLVIALRLLSEVFANLLVIGLIFAAILPELAAWKDVAVLAVGAMALLYSAWGGLSAALRTDMMQMIVFLVVFGAAFIALVTTPQFDAVAVLTAQGVAGSYNGWVLLAVAALQVFSYPVHDPVMMDRGFLNDPATTRRSFHYAFWLSTLLILAFGVFGVQAALVGAAYENELIGTWATMFPGWVFAALILSLMISALSTLDSALSSAARLVVEELKLAPRNLLGGRLAMICFAVLGTALTLSESQSLFDAVAVSGTASMFLTPVLVIGLVLGRGIAVWAYVVSFAAAMLGALVYFLRGSALVSGWLYEGHKYEQLLLICCVVLATGFAATILGSSRR
ncbi:sodium:proline symporter [Aliishimia ponticola]|uniref:Sodium:proline symporter n=1 Tax=Aliishimia ponticola TaxID=2499833 RepID=A0A4S4NBN1_9RHOB|nr:sodium:proline symporter [Aliishimia ponticola]THH36824.1 sodium:proline symporter [Aliishimia ponticola]